MDIIKAIHRTEDKEIKALLVELMEARQIIKILKSNNDYVFDFVKKNNEAIIDSQRSLQKAKDHYGFED